MNNIVDFFGTATTKPEQNWQEIVAKQQCPYLGKRCFKVRKSSPETSIGTCAVRYGRAAEPAAICPARLLERRQIFVDALHLLDFHQPGNELHIVSEVAIPGGSVDFLLVSTRNDQAVDFVGIEIQTLDTTGTLWPQRQRLLKQLGVACDAEDVSNKKYGINWRMSAKTILVQMHHKIGTFEHLNKKLVLVTQDILLAYMAKSFNFAHLNNPPSPSCSMHFHAYRLARQPDRSYRLKLQAQFGTDSIGIAKCIGMHAEARIEMEVILKSLRSKISAKTLFSPV